MSRGFGAHADLVAQDNEIVIYQYGGYNLNEPEFRNEKHLYDGLITISRSCFAEPEIHEKLKKMPSGRKKLITKRIPVSVDYPQMISDGRIIIENCSNCWHRTPDGIDVIAVSYTHLAHFGRAAMHYVEVWMHHNIKITY